MADMSRAMRTIQEDAFKIANVKLLAAIEALDWVVVHRLTEQLQEIAGRGMHRHSMDKVLPALKTTVAEREAR